MRPNRGLRARSVSMRMAVSMVMCSQPAMRALEWLVRAELLAQGHETGHFLFRHADLLTAKLSQGDVLDLVSLDYSGLFI